MAASIAASSASWELEHRICNVVARSRRLRIVRFGWRRQRALEVVPY
jgi:hypothetical protein